MKPYFLFPVLMIILVFSLLIKVGISLYELNQQVQTSTTNLITKMDEMETNIIGSADSIIGSINSDSSSFNSLETSLDNAILKIGKIPEILENQ